MRGGEGGEWEKKEESGGITDLQYKAPYTGTPRKVTHPKMQCTLKHQQGALIPFSLHHLEPKCQFPSFRCL